MAKGANVKRLKDKTRFLKKKVQEKTVQADQYRQEIKRIRSSRTFKAGKLITGMFSKIKYLLK